MFYISEKHTVHQNDHVKGGLHVYMFIDLNSSIVKSLQFVLFVICYCL